MPTDKEIDRVLDKIFKAISSKAIAKKVSLNYQKARESYVPLHPNPKDIMEVQEDVERFASHLEYCMFPGLEPKRVLNWTRQRIYQNLDRAFASQGGFIGAFHMAVEGTKGGLKTILDRMMESEMSWMESLWAKGIVDLIARELDFESSKQSCCAVIQRYQERFPEFLSDYHKNSDPGYLVRYGQWYDILISHVQGAEQLGEATKARRKR